MKITFERRAEEDKLTTATVGMGWPFRLQGSRTDPHIYLKVYDGSRQAKEVFVNLNTNIVVRADWFTHPEPVQLVDLTVTARDKVAGEEESCT